MTMELAGYQPEKPSDGGFEPFKFEGKATVEKSIISEHAGKHSDFYGIGDNVIDITATVMEGDFIGRKLFKRFNLDSEKTSGKGNKTPAMKLADQLFAVGLEFSSIQELRATNEKFAGMDIHVKAWAADFKDGRGPQQMWNIKGLAGASTKKEAVAF